MVTNDTPDGKQLEHTSFVVHVTRGLIRDQRTRRRAMVGVLAAAVLLMVCGSTLLTNALNPHERPGWFIFFWVVCAWLTITAIFLAIFDVLIVASAARGAERELRHTVESGSSGDSVDR
jgi:hypothetical protein